MSEVLLDYKNVTVKDRGIAIFEALTFKIEKGQHWAITGTATSGIPVLLQAMAGKLLVTGSVVQQAKSAVLVSNTSHFKNKSNTGDFYYQQRFNSADSQDALTVTEYLKSIQPFCESQTWTLPRTLERLNLNHLADKPVIMLSNGETRRLLLAEALIKNPALLLLDNPLAGLDMASRKNFDLLLEDVIASGINVVLATAPDEIPSSVTNIAVLDNGKITVTLLAEDFDSADYNFSEENTFDTALLQKLVADWQLPAFEYIIKMQNVSIKYGEKIILDDINWSVKQGNRWAIQGHNGAGKSTLLSLVNGDNPQAYANDIILFDRKRGSGESIWDIKKNTGFVSAELPKFFPKNQSCVQVIESGCYDTMGLFRKPKEEHREAILQWMRLTGVEAFADKVFATVPLSVQRICLLIRALIKKPPLLILDEPCQGLDSAQVNYFKTIINHICSSTQTTLLYVSHYEHEIPECVTQRLTLNAGKVLETATNTHSL